MPKAAKELIFEDLKADELRKILIDLNSKELPTLEKIILILNPFEIYTTNGKYNCLTLKCPNLVELVIDGCIEISSLDVNACKELRKCSISGTKIKEISFGYQADPDLVYADDNEDEEPVWETKYTNGLTELDVSYSSIEWLNLLHCPDLITVNCRGSMLKELNISACPKISLLDISLTSRLDNLFIKDSKISRLVTEGLSTSRCQIIVFNMLHEHAVKEAHLGLKVDRVYKKLIRARDKNLRERIASIRVLLGPEYYQSIQNAVDCINQLLSEDQEALNHDGQLLLEDRSRSRKPRLSV